MDGLDADFILRVLQYTYLEKSKSAELVSSRQANNYFSFPFCIYNASKGQCSRNGQWGQTCCSPREVEVCSVFFWLLHFISSRIYKSRMSLHILLCCSLPPAQFLLKFECSWRLHLSTCTLEKHLTEKETVQDIIGKLSCFHVKYLPPPQLQKQMETHLEMCNCGTPNGNWTTMNSSEVQK